MTPAASDSTPDSIDKAIAGSLLGETERAFLASRRVAHLATTDADGQPHVVPVCFALAGDSLFISIDEKPKRKRTGRLKRIRNLLDNPRFALVADRYDEDWTRLGWVMLRGLAEILDSGSEHHQAQALLRERYPQYRHMQLEDLPVIALRLSTVNSWGNLEPSP
ncbi:MAG: TIGR03668 family PPOX class F420-dependent oxidoreductase [Gammaproteobacteria bacterium]|nr:TIGR03668 family PPOX class F420-dependent oxidoreductase [Gammaproteobacteria bacterium]